MVQRRCVQIFSQQIKYLLLNFANCLLGFLFRLLFVGQQVVQHTLPVGVLGGAELYPFSFKVFGAVLVAVVDYYIAFAQILAVGDNHSFMEYVVKVFGYPYHFVAPCRWDAYVGCIFPEEAGKPGGFIKIRID